MKNTKPEHWDNRYTPHARLLISTRLISRLMRKLARNPLEPLIKRAIQENNAEVLLEAGCGTGDVLFRIVSHRPIEHGIGLGFS